MYRVLQWLDVKHIKWIWNVYLLETFNFSAYNHIDTIVVRHAGGKVES